jgi:hypothetical protein
VHPLFASLLGALLPDPERDAVTRRHGGDPARASGLLGAIQFVVGVDLLHDSAMAYFRAITDEVADAFLHVASRRSLGAEEAIGFTWSGAVTWFYWLLQPTTWLLISSPAVGLLRAAAYLSTRQAIGEPAVWAAVRLLQLAQRALGITSERAEFGCATQADEVEADGDDLLVYTPRLRPDWIAAATLEVAGRFYRIAAQDRAQRPAGSRYRYRLTPAGEHDVIRRLVRYAPPAPPTAAPPSRV